MDKNNQENKNNSNNNFDELEETWENIRLPEYMTDNSFNFTTKKYFEFNLKLNSFSLLGYIKNVTITIDLNQNEDQLEVLNSHKLEDEYSILQQLIDYHPNSEKRLYEPAEAKKNRYSDISPYSDNRIEIGKKGFINASRINTPFKNAFIATQGPLDNTIEDFWRMVWENNSRMILMMCETTEQKRSKCAHYWPKLSSSTGLSEFTFVNGLSIKIEDESQLDKNLTERNFLLSNSQNNEKREITQLHFRYWPDHGVPEIGSSFGTFNTIINKLENHFDGFKGKSPVVVHCSAGVGRTGTFISLYSLNFIYKKALDSKSPNVSFNIFNIVRQLKEQRRYMVQTDSQYEMIYSYFDLFVRRILAKKR